MFKYFGSKANIAHLYDYPRYPVIVEPFAGAAAYSLWWRKRDVRLNDKCWEVVDMWKWILTATHADVDAIPDLQPGERVSSYKLSIPVSLMLGHTVHSGSLKGDVYQGWSTKNGGSVRALKKRLHHHIDAIRQWSITRMDYSQLPNIEATWFIDPPYQGVPGYKAKVTDYSKLAEWCKTRKGQVIVCEQYPAAWLPFRPLPNGKRKGIAHKWRQEMVWTN